MDYTTIDRPFDSSLQRSDDTQGEVVGSSQNLSQGSITGILPTDASGSIANTDNRILSDRNFDDLWINKWIKSRNFKPNVSGFFLDGKTGDAQFNNMVLTGGIIRFGKTSFLDTTHSGFFIGPEGIFFGNAGNTNSIKFDINAGTLTFLGTFQTSTSGQRIVISSVDDTLSFIDSSGHLSLEIGGATGSPYLYINLSSTASFPAIYVENSSTVLQDAVAIHGTAGVKPGSNLLFLAQGGLGSAADFSILSFSSKYPVEYLTNLSFKLGQFALMQELNGVQIWVSAAGADPNGVLMTNPVSGVEIFPGDICYGCLQVFVAQDGTGTWA